MTYRKQTKFAYLLRKALQKLGIRVLSEIDDKHKHIDLSIPSAKMDIEIDGTQHLTDAYQIVSDLRRSHFSDLDGYDTMHIPNSEIKENLGGIASAVAEASKIREDQMKKYKNEK